MVERDSLWRGPDRRGTVDVHHVDPLDGMARGVRRMPRSRVAAPGWLAGIPAPGDTQRGPGPDDVGIRVFNDFVRNEYRTIVKSVMYTGASLEDAERAVSSALAEAYVSWPLLVNHAAWVRAVAIRNLVNDPRANTRASTPGEHGVVQAALWKLPSDQRTVMALVLGGYEPAEIADLLGTRLSDVEGTLRHARYQLRQIVRR
jgi:DNA-directed RNA polymerase specialized sigma24 family protein